MALLCFVALVLALLWVVRRLEPGWHRDVMERVKRAGNRVLEGVQRSLELNTVPGWERAMVTALRGSLAGSVLRVKELLAAFQTHVSSRATPTSILLWSQCQLALKLLCFATGIFISIYFLFSVCLLGTQNLFLLLVSLWHSLSRVVLGVTELLVIVLACVSKAVFFLLWLPFQLACKLLLLPYWLFTSTYFLLSSLANVCLVGTQNLFVLLVALWHSLVTLVLGVAELLLLVLAYVFKAVFFLLWLPFQLAYQLLSMATGVFIKIFFLSVYTLELLLHIVFLTAFLGVVVYNRELLWVLMEHVQGLPHSLQQGLGWLCQAPSLLLGMDTDRISQAWHRLLDWRLLVTLWRRAGRRMSWQRTQGRAAPTPTDLGQLPRRAGGHENPLDAEGTPDNKPRVLQEQQEERNKCVVCQDQTKTVLLLPCRHLCLCQECTEVLLQQDTEQQNCPLCRQMILQTLNVYL